MEAERGCLGEGLEGPWGFGGGPWGFRGGSPVEKNLGESLTELDEQLAVAPALVGWQGEDTGHVVILRRLLLL